MENQLNVLCQNIKVQDKIKNWITCQKCALSSSVEIINWNDSTSIRYQWAWIYNLHNHVQNILIFCVTLTSKPFSSHYKI